MNTKKDKDEAKEPEGYADNMDTHKNIRVIRTNKTKEKESVFHKREKRTKQKTNKNIIT